MNALIIRTSWEHKRIEYEMNVNKRVHLEEMVMVKQVKIYSVHFTLFDIHITRTHTHKRSLVHHERCSQFLICVLRSHCYHKKKDRKINSIVSKFMLLVNMKTYRLHVEIDGIILYVLSCHCSMLTVATRFEYTISQRTNRKNENKQRKLK